MTKIYHHASNKHVRARGLYLTSTQASSRIRNWPVSGQADRSKVITPGSQAP